MKRRVITSSSEPVLPNKIPKICTAMATNVINYTTVERGEPNTPEYRMYFQNECKIPISPIHDIPLYADGSKKVFHMVVEVPKSTREKMEISLENILNPIRQNLDKGDLRLAGCDYLWNYGILPQTWENPEEEDEVTGLRGDNRPIDVLEIGQRVAKRGEVLVVKILGVIALVDEGVIDWKIISINTNDPLANLINDIPDVDKYFPGLLKSTLEWFKIYKVSDGKPEYQFAFEGEAKPRDFALHIIEEVYYLWWNLIINESIAENVSCINVSVTYSPFNVNQETAKKLLDEDLEIH